jgi:hypothetical protein
MYTPGLNLDASIGVAEAFDFTRAPAGRVTYNIVMRLLLALVLLTLLPALTNAADKPVEFEIKNEFAFDRGITLISHSLSLSGKARLLGPDGKDIACAYDTKAKKLLFLDKLKAGEIKKYQVLNEAPKAALPKWATKSIKDEFEAKLGKETVKCQGGQVENGLLRVKVFRNDELRAEVEITTLKGGYKFRCNPLGNAVGCIDDAKYASELQDLVNKGGGAHPQLMNVYMGVPTKIEFIEPNAFQRTIKVACKPFAVKANKETPEIVSEASMEITLTWGSAIVEIKSHRKVAKTYYNHNGVFLNEFYLPQMPVDISVDGAAEVVNVKAELIAGGALDTKCKKFMLLQSSEGKHATLICVPDFEKLGIEGPKFSAFQDRMMTVISQSWHQGWKPIEIKAQDYDDKLVIVADIAATLGEAKKYGDWAAEIEKPLA